MSRRCKLDEKTIERIRALAADGVWQKALAKKYGVSEPTISHIVNRVGPYAPPRAYPRDLIEAWMRKRAEKESA